MIYIGVTGWGDHDTLYPDKIASKDKLATYAGHFPVVEVDASFYAIQPIKNVEKWVKDTPTSFKFVVKAYQGLTGHQRDDNAFASIEEMFNVFIQSLVPYQEAEKLAMVLFQFPPWFDCTRENVEYIRYCRTKMGTIPSALEFRHQSWFSPAFREKTLSFMRQEKWIHSICDEPQAGNGSIPTVLEPTDRDLTLVRFHGRNVHGWTKQTGVNWREVRYLYKYNLAELTEWKKDVIELQKFSKDVVLLFNNNSGGDAAGNAKEMLELLDISYSNLAPRQLDLF